MTTAVESQEALHLWLAERGVSTGEGCWLWTGARLRKGSVYTYGQLNVQGGHRVLAHRYTWELANGPIPDQMVVHHHCENPSCVRPSHLFLGTQSDNLRDARMKGRLSGRRNHLG